jgi:hypothetical protein
MLQRRGIKWMERAPNGVGRLSSLAAIRELTAAVEITAEFIGGHTDVLTAGPTIFGNIEEKLDVLRVECTDPRSCRLRAYRM